MKHAEQAAVGVRPTRHRTRPLVLVASPHKDVDEQLVADVEHLGSVACLRRCTAGCLRVATAVGPDLVLLDVRLPRRLEGMLCSHSATAGAPLVRLR